MCYSRDDFLNAFCFFNKKNKHPEMGFLATKPFPFLLGTGQHELSLGAYPWQPKQHYVGKVPWYGNFLSPYVSIHD